MDFSLTREQIALQQSVAQLCSNFPEQYWQDLDTRHEYPNEFVQALTDAGFLAILIPEEYGGGGGSIVDGCVVLETINRNGGSSSAAHAQMYTMGTLLRHGSDEQKARWLPEIAAGKLRLQSFGITEAEAGSDTTRITTMAVRQGESYVINGMKMWTSRVEFSDLMLLLVRTTPYNEVVKKYEGLSCFVIDLRDSSDNFTAHPIRTMVNHATYSVQFNDLPVPAANLIGEEGHGFRYILSGMNAERILVASETLGDGYWFVERASRYATDRFVFGRAIGSNQGIQFPISQAYAELEAASLLRWKAACMFEAGELPAFEANGAKLLASQATWNAANAAMTTFGGYGMASEYGIERKFREARLPIVAPVSNNLVLAQIAHQVLKMPKSY